MLDETNDPETIDILSEENNDLFFKISIEGSATGTAKARLFCEANDVLYGFNGYATEGDVVQFTIPKGKLPTGQYESAIEVFIENKCFKPVSFTMNVQKPVQITAEAVKLPKKLVEEKVQVKAQIEKKPVVAETKQQTVVKASITTKPKFSTLADKFKK